MTDESNRRGMVMALAMIGLLVGAIYFILPMYPGGGGNTNATTSSTSTIASSTTVTTGGQVCTKTEVTNTDGGTKTNDDCGLLKFIGLSTLIDGQQIYDSATGKSGQITKKVSFTHTPSKPVKSTHFNVGISALIGSTRIASNNTLIHLNGSPSNLQAVSLTLTGLKLESYSYLFANGGTLRYVLNGNETFSFTDGTLLFKQFTGTAGNASLTFMAQSPTVTNTDECGGCPLNTSGSAYTVPSTGATTLTIKVVCNADNRIICPTLIPWPPAAGGSISASYLCWDAPKLTQPCSISPSSFSGTLNANSEFSFQITSVTVGSFNGYYWNGVSVVCCAPMYAPVGYIGSITYAAPYTGSLAVQFVVASDPNSKIGGIVYISPPCQRAKDCP